MTTAYVTLETELGLKTARQGGDRLPAARDRRLRADRRTTWRRSCEGTGEDTRHDGRDARRRVRLPLDDPARPRLRGPRRRRQRGLAARSRAAATATACCAPCSRSGTRRGKPVYWIYNYKRGAFYPFVPAGGDAAARHRARAAAEGPDRRRAAGRGRARALVPALGHPDLAPRPADCGGSSPQSGIRPSPVNSCRPRRRRVSGGGRITSESSSSSSSSSVPVGADEREHLLEQLVEARPRRPPRPPRRPSLSSSLRRSASSSGEAVLALRRDPDDHAAAPRPARARRRCPARRRAGRRWPSSAFIFASSSSTWRRRGQLVQLAVDVVLPAPRRELSSNAPAASSSSIALRAGAHVLGLVDARAASRGRRRPSPRRRRSRPRRSSPGPRRPSTAP